MGFLRFFKQLNCFRCRQGKEKSTQEMEIEMGALRAKMQELQEDVFTKRRLVQQCKEAKEKYAALKSLLNELMSKVQEIEVNLQRKLQHRQVALAEVIEYSTRKIMREKKIEAIGRKGKSFMKELEKKKNNTRIWKENLRRVHSQNDVNKALPQRSLMLNVEHS